MPDKLQVERNNININADDRTQERIISIFVWRSMDSDG